MGMAQVADSPPIGNGVATLLRPPRHAVTCLAVRIASLHDLCDYERTRRGAGRKLCACATGTPPRPPGVGAQRRSTRPVYDGTAGGSAPFRDISHCTSHAWRRTTGGSRLAIEAHTAYVQRLPKLQEGSCHMSSYRNATDRRRWPMTVKASETRSSNRVLRQVNQKLLLASIGALEQRGVAEAALHRQLQALAILSHELRNGLAPIQAAVDVIDRREVVDDRLMAKLHAVIDRNVKHLSRLIGDLLDGSRVSTGQFRLERSLVNLVDIVREAVAFCQPTTMLRRQSMRVSVPVGELMVFGDRVRLTQVFLNVLENPSKYTHTGGSISIGIGDRTDVGMVAIADDGMGIRADVLPHVFDLFFQDTTGLGGEARGLGIGLAVARELVEAHGGTVTAESRGAGQGSKFTISLPLHAPSSEIVG